MAMWITEGTAARTRVQAHPIRHLLVGDARELWCSGGKGREDYNPQSPRFCPTCRTLARQAVLAGDLDPTDVHGWEVGQLPDHAG